MGPARTDGYARADPTVDPRGSRSMPVVAHPGPGSPAPPAVRLDVPQGWAQPPAGDALLAAAGPGSAGDEIAVEVRHVAAPPDVVADAVVAASTQRAGDGSGEVEEPFVVELGGREWLGRNVSWDESGTPVVEVHLATTLAADGPVSRTVLVVGRVRGAGLDADYDALQGVLETLVVEAVDA